MTQTPARRRWITFTAFAVGAVAVAVAIIAAISLRPEPLPPTDAPREQLVAFAASERFADLPPEQKQPYLDGMQKWSFTERRDAVESANLTDDQRRQAFRNTMRPMMIQRVEGYFALTGADEQQQYLDKMIDEMEAMRSAARAAQALSRLTRGTTQPSGDGNNASSPRGPSPERQKEMLEDLPPDQRAKMAAFMSAMQERRRERGLPDWPPGPPPR